AAGAPAQDQRTQEGLPGLRREPDCRRAAQAEFDIAGHATRGRLCPGRHDQLDLSVVQARGSADRRRAGAAVYGYFLSWCSRVVLRRQFSVLSSPFSVAPRKLWQPVVLTENRELLLCPTSSTSTNSHASGAERANSTSNFSACLP